MKFSIERWRKEGKEKREAWYDIAVQFRMKIISKSEEYHTTTPHDHTIEGIKV